MNTIYSLIGKILVEIEAEQEHGVIDQVYLFFHRPHIDNVYSPVRQHLLPLDDQWRLELAKIKWPSKNLPEVVFDPLLSLRALVREYLFVSLFQACADSLASENASRLVAMQRAEKNIDDTKVSLNQLFHSQRQTSIDEELFDVITGFEAMK